MSCAIVYVQQSWLYCMACNSLLIEV